MSYDPRKWTPLMGAEIIETDAVERPVRSARNGLPEHVPYHSPPGTLRVEKFSGSCKSGNHGRCRSECACFCHG